VLPAERFAGSRIGALDVQDAARVSRVLDVVERAIESGRVDDFIERARLEPRGISHPSKCRG